MTPGYAKVFNPGKYCGKDLFNGKDIRALRVIGDNLVVILAELSNFTE